MHTRIASGGKKRESLAGSKRLYLLAVFVVFLGAIVLFRLYVLQVSGYEKYRDIAEGQHKVFRELTAKRGEIYLRSKKGGYPLAVNRDYLMVFFEPKMVEDREAIIKDVSYILGMDRSEIEKKLSDPNDMFEIVKRRISQEEADRIKDLNLKGVKVTTETFRYYPGESLASQVVGFVGSDGEKTKGMYGLEAYWEKELKGENGKLSQERDSLGRWISITDRQLIPANDGVNLFLTIDEAVQFEVEKILKEAVERHKADNGSIIVQDPKTGKILAMANYPNFDPNEFNKTEDISVFVNASVSSPYEVGSVFKTFTLAAGIDAGVISPDTVYTDTGVVSEAGYNIKNSDLKAYGKQTMTDVLEKSLNTGVIFVEKLLGNERFADYVRRFGFGDSTGIELPGESKGNIRNLENYRRTIQFFTASYGQGITATPLQLVNAYSAIANDGMLMKPRIVERIVYSDGREESSDAEEIRQAIRPEVARQAREMLGKVVENGHGKRAGVPGYRVGGKTGTAQVAKSGEKGYEDDITIGSFAGMAPLDDPRFTVVVKISNPKDVIWAESSAAPTFGEVMKFLLNYYNIEPTEPIKE
ncbi:MAG: penicillin-binding protein 2 [Candidatus Moranbacteria bacterium]|jgi:cell division protein FtsI/penicillin-binding protein 2|nr:penicillin-binding protein 2 [Candidatus Moranbacteria bacterium]MDD5652155.1 penicillin-binding protein 2 [Candidatus Moranbacteria bacterium]MDX9856053.1 penicillin-binding protein 2 [Candidatus Moranbacteria bacterium]